MQVVLSFSIFAMLWKPSKWAKETSVWKSAPELIRLVYQHVYYLRNPSVFLLVLVSCFWVSQWNGNQYVMFSWLKNIQQFFYFWLFGTALLYFCLVFFIALWLLLYFVSRNFGTLITYFTFTLNFDVQIYSDGSKIFWIFVSSQWGCFASNCQRRVLLNSKPHFEYLLLLVQKYIN